MIFSKDTPYTYVFTIPRIILGGFSYQYSLQIDGKPYKTFLDNQTKVRYTVNIVERSLWRVPYILGHENLDPTC